MNTTAQNGAQGNNTAMAQAMQQAGIASANAEAALAQLPDEKPHTVSTATFISAINNATVSYKYALQLEMSTGLVLFAEAGEASRDSKRALQQVYIAAGYDCADQYKQDYKTIRRRIDASAALFDWMGKETILKLIENRAEMNAIMACVQHLEQYNLKGINSVLALCGRPVILKREKPAEKNADEPKEEPKKAISVRQYQDKDTHQETQKAAAPATESNMEVAKALGQHITEMREQRAKEGTKFINTENIRVEVDAKATKAEIIQLSMQLLALAGTMPDVAKPAEAPAKEEQQEPTDGQLQTMKQQLTEKPEANGNVPLKAEEKKPRVHRATRKMATA